VKLDIPSQGHVFEHALRFPEMGLGFPISIWPGRRLDTHKAYTLTGVEHQRIPVDHPHHPAAFSGLEPVKRADVTAGRQDAETYQHHSGPVLLRRKSTPRLHAGTLELAKEEIKPVSARFQSRFGIEVAS
jgi:hypothetical protein